MSVELIPNCRHCHQLGVAIGTFRRMIFDSGIADYLGIKVLTNDPVNATDGQAIKCAELLQSWTPPEDFGGGVRPGRMKEYFLEFFRRCDGFTTR